MQKNQKLNGLRIIIVEDDPIIAMGLKALLSDYGVSVTESFAKGEDFISYIADEDTHSLFDLALLDIELAGDLDGIEVSAELEKIVKKPYLFLSALSDEETLRRAANTSSFGYLFKPYEADELVETIEVFLKNYKVAETEVEGADDQSPIDILSDLPPEEQKILKSILFEKTWEEGEHLIYPGDSKETGGFLITSGRAALYNTTRSGKELIVSLLGNQALLGLLFCKNFEDRLLGVKAQTPVKGLWLSKADFQKNKKFLPVLNESVSSEIIDKLLDSFEFASALAHSKVETRIIQALRTLSSQFGKKGSDAFHSRLFLTRKELADITGTTPETAIRATKKLERDGLLDLSRPGIIKIMDMDKLLTLLDS